MPEEALASFISELLAGVRGEAKLSADAFVRSAQAGYGGVLRIQAPCKSRDRVRYEIGFQSERYADID